MRRSLLLVFLPFFVLCPLLTAGMQPSSAYAANAAIHSMNTAFEQAAKEFGTPAVLLKALCYMEGRLSNHNGAASIDGGYGCMHLTTNTRTDTLDKAATLLQVSTQQLKLDSATNIRGGAVILRNDALQLSSAHTVPTRLADWYGAVALYSGATTRSVALLYANSVYQLLNSGFNATSDTGETVTLAPQGVQANISTAAPIPTVAPGSLPQGCINDGKVDYSGAIDCIVNPAVDDCNIIPDTDACNYESSNRPTDPPLTHIVIHDIEGTALNALNIFLHPRFHFDVSVHYVVDSDGTVYQVIHEKDIAYHAGNFWYNQRSVGIEHAGFDATGFLWYNATEYLASARLVAYLLQKYDIPLDHDHIVAHVTIPSTRLVSTPNHVDPGPYWLWDYYFNLIHEQGVPFPGRSFTRNIVTLHPSTDLRPLGGNGRETPANFNYFYLYTGPSTNASLIPQEESGSDVTDETDNIEPYISYYYLAKVADAAGTGDTMYEIWYGEFDKAHSTPASQFSDAQLAWLAVPPHTAISHGLEAQSSVVVLCAPNNGMVQISGRPITGSEAVGESPSGAIFVSAYHVFEDQTNNLWYEINYNHRQSWVPASNVTVISPQNLPV